MASEVNEIAKAEKWFEDFKLVKSYSLGPFCRSIRISPDGLIILPDLAEMREGRILKRTLDEAVGEGYKYEDEQTSPINIEPSVVALVMSNSPGIVGTEYVRGNLAWKLVKHLGEHEELQRRMLKEVNFGFMADSEEGPRVFERGDFGSPFIYSEGITLIDCIVDFIRNARDLLVINSGMSRGTISDSEATLILKSPLDFENIISANNNIVVSETCPEHKKNQVHPGHSRINSYVNKRSPHCKSTSCHENAKVKSLLDYAFNQDRTNLKAYAVELRRRVAELTERLIVKPRFE
jgi:hypothetical protein